ncbi:MAG: AAA family ATPase [Dehalococcoidia bacterium]|nr:AAA family ATPase [Dehalococcoidia bacterium]
MREPFASFVETELPSAMLLITCGLPGTWKTETSEEVSRIKAHPIVRSDLVRKEVLGNEDIFDEKVASDMDKRMAVYAETFRRAAEALAGGGGVIIDATFVKQSLRRRAAEIAARYNRPLVILQTSCPREVSISRILKRTRDKYESNALTEQAYVNNEKTFEFVDLDELKKLYPSLDIIHLIVDTQCDLLEDWFVTGMVQR